MKCSYCLEKNNKELFRYPLGELLLLYRVVVEYREYTVCRYSLIPLGGILQYKQIRDQRLPLIALFEAQMIKLGDSRRRRDNKVPAQHRRKDKKYISRMNQYIIRIPLPIQPIFIDKNFSKFFFFVTPYSPIKKDIPQFIIMSYHITAFLHAKMINQKNYFLLNSPLYRNKI